MEAVDILRGCKHEPRFGKEICHEWIEVACADCWALYEAARRKQVLLALAARKPKYKEIESGRFSVLVSMEERSGRPDGLWLVGSVTKEELEWLQEGAE